VSNLRSAPVLPAMTSATADSVSAWLRRIRFVADTGFVPFHLTTVGGAPPRFSFFLPVSGTFTVTDAYPGGHPFRINVATLAAQTIFTGLTFMPGTSGAATSNPSAALTDAASSHASINISAGSYTVTSSVAASSYGGGGALAGRVSSITANSRSGSGVNALLGFPLPGGTSAFLLCRHAGRAAAVA
jgi:hypothetical protein